MNLVTKIIEPKRLLLIWQKSDQKIRRRFVVGEIFINDETGRVCLRYCVGHQDFDDAVEAGFDLYPAFKPANRVHCDGVLAALMRRLPPRSRDDFDEYLLRHRINPAAKLSDFALLGYTGAKLPTDGFSVVHPFDAVDSPCELLVEVAGYRFHGKNERLRDGVVLSLEREPENEQDPNAIAFFAEGVRVGYVPRPLTPAFSRWLDGTGVTAVIEKFNGTAEQPRVYAFVKVE